MLTLHSYWRSGAAHRVRIALELKQAPYQIITVNLLNREQKAPAYLARNPQGLVPLLETGSVAISQSLAIMEWLDEAFPATPLLPAHPDERARVRAIAAAVACDIHPLNNLRVLQTLKTRHGADDSAVAAWASGWIVEGFNAIEKMAFGAGPWIAGSAPGLADCCLAPQTFAAQSRYNIDVARWPRLAALTAAAEAHPAFIAAHPANQPDTQR